MAVMDAQALNTDPEGMSFLSDVLGTSPEANAGRRFPVEAWNPALRVMDRIRFGTVEPQSTVAERMPAHAE